jgi:hypothetical protein
MRVFYPVVRQLEQCQAVQADGPRARGPGCQAHHTPPTLSLASKTSRCKPVSAPPVVQASTICFAWVIPAAPAPMTAMRVTGREAEAMEGTMIPIDNGPLCVGGRRPVVVVVW